MPFVFLGIVVLLVLGSLGYTMLSRSVVYYRTPTEVLAAPGEQVRLSGRVVDGSVRVDAANGVVTFVVADRTSQVPVRFEGAAPDTLEGGANAVAEGTLGTDGTFHAKTLLAKCPSKFSSKETS
jgi:cytochrome c-type biogenesis protein CcmE